jgi:hypothetical protein
MWSLAVLARDLCAFLDDLHIGRPPGAGRRPAASFAEHTELLAAAPPPPEAITRRWAEVLEAGSGTMPRFPLPLGDLDSAHPDVMEVREVLDGPELAALEDAAAADGVRLIGAALSVITAATRELADAPLRAVFPVHSRHDGRWHDAVGWFITNSVLECDDPDPRACSRAVRDAIALGSHPLAPILEPYGGMPASPGMFAFSWLDVRRLPVRVPEAADAQYVSAAIDTDGVMIWFIVRDDGLQLRCRHPDTAQARQSVGAWLDLLVDGLRAAAASPASAFLSNRRGTREPHPSPPG